MRHLTITTWRRHAAALLVLSIAALVVTWPMGINPKSSIFGAPGDSTGSIADLWYQHQFGLKFFGSRQVTIQGAPLGYVERLWPLLTSSLLLIPAWIFGFLFGEVFVYNLLILSGLVLTGYTTFLLLTYLRVRPWLSIFGGLVFTMMPFHVLSATSWYSQTHLEAIPLTLLFGLRFLEHRSPRTFIYVLLAAGSGLLMNAYVGLMCAVVVLGILFVVCVSLIARQSWKVRVAVLVSIGGLVGLTVLLLGLIRDRLALSLGRTRGELNVYGLRLSEWARPSGYSRIWGNSSFSTQFRDLHGSNPVEVSLYVGATLLILAVLFLVISRTRSVVEVRQRRALTPLVTLIVLALWIAMSQGVHIGPIELPNAAETLFGVLPYWRVFSRVSLVADLGVVVLAVMMLDFMCGEIHRSKKNTFGSLRFVGALVIAMIAIADLKINVPVQNTKVQTPPIVDEIRHRVNGIFAAYPIKPWFDPWTYDLRFWQRIHGKAMLNGGVDGAEVLDLQAALLNPSRPETVDTLDALGIKWLVIDRPQFKLLTNSTAPQSSRLRKVIRAGRYEMMKIDSSPVAAGAWVSGDTYGPELDSDGRTWRWLASQVFSVQTVTKTARCYELELNWQNSLGDVPDLYLKIPSGRTTRIKEGQSASIFLNEGLTHLSAITQSPMRTLPDGRVASIFITNPILQIAQGDDCLK